MDPSRQVDLLLRRAWVVDGTGAPGRVADVAVRGDRIVRVGDGAGLDARTTIDLDGLVLAPGFIDPHTHYDAQVLWDRDLTPSSWHGVTTVVIGNCGFGVAPTRPEHRDLVLRTLEQVEGMPLAALEAGMRWNFETFPEYLAAIASEPVRLNVAVLIGHTPLRYHVMGADATERVATADEVEQMCELVGEALDAGAVGFSTSRSESHLGAHGRPVPSRVADLDEIRALARVLGERDAGTMEATWGPDLHVEEFAELAVEIGRPISWAALMTIKEQPEYARALMDRVAAAGGPVHPQVACRPIVVQVTLADPAPLANVDAFAEIIARPRAERAAAYADADWRARARVGIRERWGDKLEGATVQETVVHRDLLGGPTLGELAAAAGTDPLDVMVDLALADDLSTRFRVVMINDDDEQIAALLQDPRYLLGLSDAGAHTSQLCDANYATHLLSHWTRDRGTLTLEEAVHRLTGHPAAVYGIADRGNLVEGAVADLVAFDAATVGSCELERVHDLPGGTDRLVARSTGIEHVWVAGVAIRLEGEDLPDARPGAVLREFAT